MNGNEGMGISNLSSSSADTSVNASANASIDDSVDTKAPINFSLPEQYKERSWAAKIKTEEDLYKQIDGLSELVGKKHMSPGKEATTEEWSNYFDSLKPENKDAYQFEGVEIQDSFKELLFNSKISSYQAEALAKGYQELEKQIVADSTSSEGFVKEMSSHFGKDYEPVVAEVSNILKSYVSPEVREVLDGMPNQYLAPVYGAIQDIVKSYGIKEKGPVEPSKGLTGVDLDTKRDEIRNKMISLKKVPHTAEEFNNLQTQLENTYK